MQLAPRPQRPSSHPCPPSPPYKPPPNLVSVHARLVELESMDYENLQAKHGMEPSDYVAAYE